MAVWMSMDQFSGQLGAIKQDTRAPCPSEFDEGDCYWIKEFPVSFEDECLSSKVPSDADVVIIGSGISGTAMAYHLANRQPDLKVAMFEARVICTGATGRNGGHLCRAEQYDIRALASVFGNDDAVRMRQMTLRNRDMMLETIKSLGIGEQIDLQLGGTTAIFGSEEERDDFQKDVDFAKELGMPCEGRLLSQDETIEKFKVSRELAKYGSAYLELSGSLYPRKLVAAVLKDVRARMPNFSIHPYTPVTSVEKSEGARGGGKEQYIIKTGKGDIRASVVLHATNAYASKLIPCLSGSEGVFGVKAEVMAVQPRDDVLPPNQLRGGLGYDKFWHWLVQRPDNGPFIYGWSGVEKVGDYDDSKILSDSNSRKKMCEWLETSLPDNFSTVQWDDHVKNCWTGVQGLTLNGTSYVGRPDKERSGEFMSVGHNGEGMGRCWACAFVVIDKAMHYLEEDESSTPWKAPEWFPNAFLKNI
ncbi:unnamed protein product [Fusarium equiseti]|uniref:FAD dependent oxidoreductase domain-containing protein n=1 Tax=Fusarium equiseti TaxID=61235 RepID=A0A8J2NLP2_FUSEQ|nr:unnamed protein product [Fusarium equiseti]